jgi:hypothetical protein
MLELFSRTRVEVTAWRKKVSIYYRLLRPSTTGLFAGLNANASPMKEIANLDSSPQMRL